MKPLALAMPGNRPMASAIAGHLDAEVTSPVMRKFPDGETYLRIDARLHGRFVTVVDTLAHPDSKVVPLLFAADTARDLGAATVGLVAPYLAYMRQDRRFNPGEAITSRTIARLLSAHFDWLVTVDPHLHRYKSLTEIYSIPADVLHAAPLMADWIAKSVRAPFLIGPDSESVQWVGAVAQRIGAPFGVLEKTRRGDRDVEVRLDGAIDLGGRTPVLVDDIVSSGQTMLKAVELLKLRTETAPVCVAVHGIFADGSDERLQAQGARLVTANTVPHASNAIDVSGLLADAVRRKLQFQPA